MGVSLRTHVGHLHSDLASDLHSKKYEEIRHFNHLGTMDLSSTEGPCCPKAVGVIIPKIDKESLESDVDQWSRRPHSKEE